MQSLVQIGSEMWICIRYKQTHTHTHTHIELYIYIYKILGVEMLSLFCTDVTNISCSHFRVRQVAANPKRAICVKQYSTANTSVGTEASTIVFNTLSVCSSTAHWT
jgi:hypothetical protein